MGHSIQTVSISAMLAGGLNLGGFGQKNKVPFNDWGDLVILGFRCWGEKVFWKVRV
jgi:hypothetical protein